mgnify:CR=1 FL=1
MNLPKQIANHFREFHFGGNATGVNLKDSLADVSWEQATTPVYSLNTIAVLAFHINYYIAAVLKVLEGGPLDAHDKYSFDAPPIKSQEDWQKLLDKIWSDAEKIANLVEQLPEQKLGDVFVKEKYGNYFRNFHGIIEHSHYHLGQIVLIKKILTKSEYSSNDE